MTGKPSSGSMMEVSATLKGCRISPQKCRLVANPLRGLSVERALETLRFSNTKSALLVLKLLESAVANAENNQGADIDELKVRAIWVNEGTTINRFRARARGRASAIKKRTSHITVTLSDE